MRNFIKSSAFADLKEKEVTYVQRINSHKKQYASAGTEKASHLGCVYRF